MARPITPGLFTNDADGPRLVVGRCLACGRSHFPAGDTCPYCAADSCRAERAGPRGRIWLATVVTARPPGYRGPIPYGFGLVELADGLRVVSRLLETDVSKLPPGRDVELVIDTLATDDDGTAVESYAFAPVGA